MGFNLEKNVFKLKASLQTDGVVIRRQISRAQLLTFFDRLP